MIGSLLPLLQNDPRLAAKVDLHAKIVPVAEAVADLGRAAHLTLETTLPVRGYKATILVEGMPVGRVMDRLADVLRLKWERTDAGYRLVLDKAAQAREDAFMADYAAQRRATVEKEFRDRAAGAKLPYAGVQKAITELRDDITALRPEQEAERKNLNDRMSALYLVNTPEGWIQGRMLASLDAKGWDRFFAGEPLGASTAATPGGIALPADAKDYTQYPGGFQQKSKRLDAFLRYDPETGAIQQRTDRASAEDNGASMGRSGGGFGTYDSIPEGLNDSPFAKELAAWDQETPTGPDALRKTDPKTPERASEWWAGYRSDADQLEWLHDATGLPVVAMAVRVPNRRSGLVFSGTVADYVKAWREKGWGYFRLADGFLMERPGGFWQRHRVEIPEGILRPLEAKPAPTIDDYADAAARITPNQAGMASDVSNYLLRVCPYPFADGGPALRLWGTLSRSQRETLRAGGAVTFAGLDPSGQAVFADAVTDVFAGGWHNGPMAARFTGARLGRFDGWAVFGKSKDVRAVGRSQPVPLDFDYFKGGSPQMKMEPDSAGIDLMLGLSPDDAVKYTLPLAGLPKAR